MLTEAQRTEILSGSVTTVPLAGKLLGIGTSRAYQSARDGEIPTIRLGRKLVVPTAALAAMLKLSPASLAA